MDDIERVKILAGSNAEMFARSRIADRYAGRGFSSRAIECLTKAGFDFPEKILDVPLTELGKIPGVGKAVIDQIEAYIALVSARNVADLNQPSTAKPTGPATDAIERMEAEIAADRGKGRKA